MARQVLVINGHPDPDPARLCHALADACAAGAAATHAVSRLNVGALDFPVLRSRHDYENGAPPQDIARAQAMIRAADHLTLVFPIWLGTTPALLAAFLEQTLRPGYARERTTDGAMGATRMNGRSVRLIVTMAMPALAYRFYFFNHGLANLRRAVLGFVGFGPIRTTLIGGAAQVGPERAARLLAQAHDLGRRAV